MKRIGILGGASDQATADYYRRFNKAANDLFGGSNTAELIISSMNFAFSRDCALNGRWEEMAAYLAERATALERAGAELILCASNSLHRVAERFCSRLTVPFLHIVDPTANAILDAGLQHVGLLGTKSVMTPGHLRRRYGDIFGITILVPEENEQVVIDRVIFEELCKGQFSAEAKTAYLQVVDKLQTRGAQGIILGCTEIPLLISQQDRADLPMFDTAGLHVAAAIKFAVQGTE